MALVSLEPSELKRLVRQRRVTGADRFDEVWDGVYVMAPLADNEHQSLGLNLAIAFKDALDRYPWALELYRAAIVDWTPVGRVDLQGSGQSLMSEILGVSFRLVAGATRPQIEITRNTPPKTWLV